MPIRALLDANVFISYLLSPDNSSAVIRVVEGAFTGVYQLLLPEEVIEELRGKTATKPWLVTHITPEETERLVDILATVAEVLPEIGEPLPEVGRDRKDDYLFAHAMVGRADFLVSGDKGVQAVGRIGEVQVVSPAGFLAAMEGNAER
jgi:putative PIN family toxin of toxin-antitoxin system